MASTTNLAMPLDYEFLLNINMDKYIKEKKITVQGVSEPPGPIGFEWRIRLDPTVILRLDKRGKEGRSQGQLSLGKSYRGSTIIGKRR